MLEPVLRVQETGIEQCAKDKHKEAVKQEQMTQGEGRSYLTTGLH